MKGKTSPITTEYRYGFHDEGRPVYQTAPGLSSAVVEEISSIKKEPGWMRRFRLGALKVFEAKPMPSWGADLSAINFAKIIYYVRPWEKQANSWEEVPPEIKATFEKIGVPEAEKKFFAGAAAQYDSEVIYHAINKNLAAKGVIFTDMDTGLREHPEIVKKYFGTIIPVGDNKFAALNSACWSGGSFIYVPPGVKVDMPLQAYFRINAEGMGQFERTLIIADEGSEVHYLEGCFGKGTTITANPSYKPIEAMEIGDKVLTHHGRYKRVYHTQKRPYTGDLYTIKAFGDPSLKTEVTDEHPFLYVRRQFKRDRNRQWVPKWGVPKELKRLDYLVVPIVKTVRTNRFCEFEVEVAKRGNKWLIAHKERIKSKEKVRIPSNKDFFTLIGYYLAEGSISSGYYLNFSFGLHEKAKIREVEKLLKKVLGVSKVLRSRHKSNNGLSLVVSSVRLAQVFKKFGTSAATKSVPHWVMLETPAKQAALIRGYFNGDGNYYGRQNKHGFKEIFRMNTVSSLLARQMRDMLLRLGIAAFIHARDRKKENRQTMYTIGIGGKYMIPFGKVVGIDVNPKVHGHRRASMFGLMKNYAFFPINSITKRRVSNFPVYNFSVENDETYVANSVAVHNCTAPVYSRDSLHSAVVEIIAKPYSRVRYTTIQNWSRNVYNLVTKRARAEEGAFVEWVDCNLGSRVTMKYPSVILAGRGSRADTLSIAMAGPGQHQDSGAKMIHLASDTRSNVVAKSVSFGGGRTSYRGLARVVRGAKNAKLSVRCDALLMDPASRSDTYPTMKIDEQQSHVEHEAKISRIGEKELFYLRSRGLSEIDAASLIVGGFFEPLVKYLPVDYAVEMNRLIKMEMEGSVG